MKTVRVRFAPSPTGALHIGGLRTALYNFLLARQNGGTMILRIEDTDQTRLVPGAEAYILDSLKWAGITIDEGAGVGGPHAPYRQSERKNLYRQYAEKLLQNGHAYYAFDTPQELESMRQQLPNAQYDSKMRMQMKNSLTFSATETTQRVSSGQPYAIRLKVPETGEIHLNDLIRGSVTFSSSDVDDKVLMKSDGMPTYHLANVVDDHLMKISHVIRGEEWLPSSPLHVLLYRYLGWESEMPSFAHLPLLLKPDGNGKLSKRDADRLGFPLFPLNWNDPKSGEQSLGFRELGYLPEAVNNFLALLGWNPGTDQELFTLTQLVEAFSLEKIHKAGARFDIQKAQWFNQQYLRAKTDAELSSYLLESLKKESIECSTAKAIKIVGVMKERVTFPNDFWASGQFFFRAPSAYDEQVVAKRWNDDAVKVLSSFRAEVSKITSLTADAAKDTLEKVTGGLGIKTGQILAALRVSLTGGASGPDLMMTMEILGNDEVAKRIGTALEKLKVKV